MIENDSIGSLTSYLHWQHPSATMLGGGWRPEVRCDTLCLPSTLLEEAVEQQQQH
jgi:hypothetical protein